MFKKINDYINNHYIKTFVLALAVATLLRVAIEFFVNGHFLMIDCLAAAVVTVVVAVLIGFDFKKK
ncbi:hypothetical protein ACVQ8P_06560 [Dellaglioa sp. BT-FLS60]